jgi:flagellin
MALNMQSMLKNKSITNSLLPKTSSSLKITKDKDAVELAISEKMKSQIRDLSEAEGISCDDETSLNEAKTTIQDITGILGDMQEILQTIQSKNFNNDSYDVLEDEFKGLQEDFASLSSKEIFKSYWLQNGLKKSNDIVSKINLADFNFEEIKDLVSQYENKLIELENVNKKFRESFNKKDVTDTNISAAESHIQNIATAEEIVDKTKLSISNESKEAMLSQAKKDPKQVINLLE